MLAFFLSALESEEERRYFREIYQAHHGRMERTALGILKNQSDVEDAVQNAFVQVIRHFEQVAKIPCEELPYWLVSVVKNEALAIWRKRRPTVPLEDWTEQRAEQTTDYASLVQLFRELPETYRAVLEMKLLLGYTDREIGEKLGISETAVSSRASRGRALLRSIIEREGIVP